MNQISLATNPSLSILASERAEGALRAARRESETAIGSSACDYAASNACQETFTSQRNKAHHDESQTRLPALGDQ
jgi:hypothetical protein